KILIVVALLLLSLAVVGYFTTRRLYIENLKPVDTSKTEPSIFVIARGSSVEQVTTNLHAQKRIRSTAAFKQYMRSNQLNDQIKAGTYRLSPSKSSQDIAG